MKDFFPHSTIFDPEKFSTSCIIGSSALNSIVAIQFAHYNLKIIKKSDNYLLKEIDRLDGIKFSQYLNKQHIALLDATTNDITNYCIQSLHVKLKKQTVLAGASGTIGAINLIDYTISDKTTANLSRFTIGAFVIGSLATIASVIGNAYWLQRNLNHCKASYQITDASTEKLNSIQNNEVDFRNYLYQATAESASTKILLIGVSVIGNISKIIGRLTSPALISPIITLFISAISAVSGIINLRMYMKLGNCNQNALPETMAYTISSATGSKNSKTFEKHIQIHKEHIITSFNLDATAANLPIKQLVLLLKATDLTKLNKLMEEITAHNLARNIKDFCKKQHIPFTNSEDLVNKFIINKISQQIYNSYIKVVCLETCKLVVGLSVMVSLFTGPLTFIIIPCMAISASYGSWYYHMTRQVNPGRKLGEKLCEDLLDPSKTFSDVNLQEQATLCRKLVNHVGTLIDMDINDNYPITSGQAQSPSISNGDISMIAHLPTRAIKYFKLLCDLFGYTSIADFLSPEPPHDTQLITTTLQEYMTQKKSQGSCCFANKVQPSATITIASPLPPSTRDYMITPSTNQDLLDKNKGTWSERIRNKPATLRGAELC